VIAGVAFYSTNMTTNAKISKVVLSIIQETKIKYTIGYFPGQPKIGQKRVRKVKVEVGVAFLPNVR
jgi:hypothetical protein